MDPPLLLVMQQLEARRRQGRAGPWLACLLAVRKTGGGVSSEEEKDGSVSSVLLSIYFY